MNVKFGISGWRAVFAEDLTFAGLRKLTHAVAGHVKENPDFGASSPDYRAQAPGASGQPPLVVVGYDTRFLSPELAREAAEVFAADGVRVLLSDTEVPTAAVGLAVRQHKAVGGLVVTGGGGPARVNGCKWLPFWGGAAIPAATDDIERRAALLGGAFVTAMGFERAAREGWIAVKDLKPSYVRHLAGLLDVRRVRVAGLKVAVDAMHGAARVVWAPLLEALGVRAPVLRPERDVLFGGMAAAGPAPEGLAGLAALVKGKALALGLAAGGDGETYGVLDSGGAWVEPNDVLALALDHLVRNRGMRGKAARSLMTSHFVDAVARAAGLETRETPAGFKHVGDLLRAGDVVLAGEESGTISMAGHVPEPDGILGGLLMLELAAFDRKPLARLKEALQKRVGRFHTARRDFRFDSPHQAVDLEARLRVKPPLHLAGVAVWRLDETDGFKFIMKDGSWLGLRLLEAEPAVRVYAEAGDAGRLEALLAEGAAIVKGSQRGR